MIEPTCNYIVYNNTPDARIIIGNKKIEPNQRNIRIEANNSYLKLMLPFEASADFTQHEILERPGDYSIIFNKVSNDAEIPSDNGVVHRVLISNCLNSSFFFMNTCIRVSKILDFATTLTPLEKDSVKHWYLVSCRLQKEDRALVPELTEMVVKYIYKSLAQDLLKRVIASDALNMLRRAKIKKNNDMITLLENYLNVNYLETLIKKLVQTCRD